MGDTRCLQVPCIVYLQVSRSKHVVRAGFADFRKLLWVSLPTLVAVHLIAIYAALRDTKVGIGLYLRPPKARIHRLNACIHFLVQSSTFICITAVTGTGFLVIFLLSSTVTAGCSEPMLRCSISITKLDTTTSARHAL